MRPRRHRPRPTGKDDYGGGERSMSESFRLAVFRMPNWLGDAVMALPALDFFMRRRPDVRVVVACREGLADLFRAHPAVVGLLAAPLGGWDGFWHGCLRPYRIVLPSEASLRLPGASGETGDPPAARESSEALKRRLAAIGDGGAFDLGVLLPNSFSSAWWLWRLGAARRVGYRRDARGWLLTRRLAADRAARLRHMTDYYLQLARAAVEEAASDARAACPTDGLDKDSATSAPGDGHSGDRLSGVAALEADCPRDPTLGLPVPEIRLSAAGEREADRWLRFDGVEDERADSDRVQTVVMAPLTLGPAKDWPPERYSELTERFASAGWRVLLTGTAGQAEACERIAAGRPGVLNLAGRTTLSGFFSLLKRCQLFVGNDSGGAHAAAALGAPSVVIYGLSDPARTRQLGRRVSVVSDMPTGPEAGHEFRTRPLSDRRLNWRDPAVLRRARDRLASIPVERALEAAQRLGVPL